LDGAADFQRYLLLTTSIWALWHMHGHFAEGKRLLERGLSGGGADTSAVLRGRALRQLGNLTNRLGDTKRALSHIAASIAVFSDAEERMEEAWTRNLLGLVLTGIGDYDRARECFTDTLVAFRELGGDANIARSFSGLAAVAYGKGQLDLAMANADNALCHTRLAGPGSEPFAIIAYNILALVNSESGNHQEASDAMQHSLALGTVAEDRQGLPTRIAIGATLAGRRGLHDAAARLIGAAQAQGDSLGRPFLMPEKTAIDQTAAAACSALGAECFAKARFQGQTCSAEAAIAELQVILNSPVPAPIPDDSQMAHPLTQRETDVLRLLAAGRTNQQVGDALSISPRTAQTHITHLLAKLGLANRTEAAAYAHRHGLG
jgi:non-specific serine/threonine protein kinase